MMEDSINPAAAADNGATLSKSQKKRLRQKRKKARAANDDTVSVASSDASLVQQQATATAVANSDEYNNILTPAERQALLNEGFSMAEIVQAVEVMWDQNLAYDEYDAVLQFLKGEIDEELVVMTG